MAFKRSSVRSRPAPPKKHDHKLLAAYPLADFFSRTTFEPFEKLFECCVIPPGTDPFIGAFGDLPTTQ